MNEGGFKYNEKAFYINFSFNSFDRWMCITNKFLYEQLNLKASYVYNVLRDWESQYPIPLG